MKTLKQIEKEFDEKIVNKTDLSNVSFEIKKVFFEDMDMIKLFYRKAIAKLLGEVVGEDCQCLDDKAELWIDGYDSAKAEIRERIKSILE